MRRVAQERGNWKYARLGEVVQGVVDVALQEMNGNEEALIVKLLHFARKLRKKIQGFVELRRDFTKKTGGPKENQESAFPSSNCD